MHEFTYVLVSVIERGISVSFHTCYLDAYEKMSAEFAQLNVDLSKKGEEWEFSEFDAWANTNNMKNDWLIEEINKNEPRKPVQQFEMSSGNNLFSTTTDDNIGKMKNALLSKDNKLFRILLEEACRQWCEFIAESPERINGKGFANFFCEICEDKQLEYEAIIDCEGCDTEYQKGDGE